MAADYRKRSVPVEAQEDAVGVKAGQHNWPAAKNGTRPNGAALVRHDWQAPRIAASESPDAAEKSEAVNRFVNSRSVVGLPKRPETQGCWQYLFASERGCRSYRRREDGTELSFVARRRGGPPNVKRVNWG